MKTNSIALGVAGGFLMATATFACTTETCPTPDCMMPDSGCIYMKSNSCECWTPAKRIDTKNHAVGTTGKAIKTNRDIPVKSSRTG